MENSFAERIIKQLFSLNTKYDVTTTTLSSQMKEKQFHSQQIKDLLFDLSEGSTFVGNGTNKIIQCIDFGFIS